MLPKVNWFFCRKNFTIKSVYLIDITNLKANIIKNILDTKGIRYLITIKYI